MKVQRLIVVAVLVLSYCSTAHAVLKHRYSFNGNVNDSISGANGTVVDVGAPTAVFSGGQLDLSANTAQASNTITEDAYVNLPNGIVKNAFATNNAISFEFWATVSEQHTWQRFGDFGTSNNGEDTSASGSTSNYMLITPNSGRAANGVEMTNHISTGNEPNLGLNGPFLVGTQQHVVAVYDKNNTSGGTNPGGTMSLYLNGVPVTVGGTGVVGTGAIDPAFTAAALNDNNNWLGRSQWNDPVFDGKFNEFRIYNNALTAAEVTTSFTRGPDVIPEPISIAGPAIAAFAVALWRRRARASAC